MLGLVGAMVSSDLGEMRRLHRALAPYRRALARIGQPAAVKAAMRIRGYAGSLAVRVPYAECSGDDVNCLRDALAECDAAVGAPTTSLEVHS
jgi:dihydrodipicolinate synthase/N-acetylneuraminate lyase